MHADTISREHQSFWIRLESADLVGTRVEATCKSDLMDGATDSRSIELKISTSELNTAYDSIRSASQIGPSGHGQRSQLDPVRDLGARLFNALFEESLGKLYRDSVEIANDRRSSLRICISATEGSLASELPWEFLYDPLRGDFVGLSDRRPILRQAEPSLPAPAVSLPCGPICVALMRSPDPQQTMQTNLELKMLQTIFSTKALQIDVASFEVVSPDKLLQVISSGKFDIIHFAGHAYEQSAELFPLGAQDLAVGPSAVSLPQSVLANSLLKQNRLRLLYLSACNTHRLAAQLSRFVPNTIGMRAFVSANFCVQFASDFYQALLSGAAIERAVSEARQRGDVINPGGRDWGMAVLCTHVETPSYLIEHTPRPESELLESAVVSAPKSPETREWQRLSLLHELHRRNLQALDESLKSITSAREDTIASQGAVEDLRGQVSKLKDKVREIEKRMLALK